MHTPLTLFFRWMHITAAAVALGGVFFARILLPLGLKNLDPDLRQATFLKLRRLFKMVIHTCILLLIVSGIYNSMGNWPAYHQIPQQAQPLWGTHVLLALIIFSIALMVLAGKEPPPAHKSWMAVNLALLFITFAVAAALKYVRDNRPPTPPPAPALANLE